MGDQGRRHLPGCADKGFGLGSGVIGPGVDRPAPRVGYELLTIGRQAPCAGIESFRGGGRIGPSRIGPSAPTRPTRAVLRARWERGERGNDDGRAPASRSARCVRRELIGEGVRIYDRHRDRGDVWRNPANGCGAADRDFVPVREAVARICDGHGRIAIDDSQRISAQGDGGPGLGRGDVVKRAALPQLQGQMRAERDVEHRGVVGPGKHLAAYARQQVAGQALPAADDLRAATPEAHV